MEKNKKNNQCNVSDFDLIKVFAGLMIILSGFFYFLKALGFIVFDFNIFNLWPLLIIFLGLSFLVKKNIVSNIIGIITLLMVLFIVSLSIFSYQFNHFDSKNIPIGVELEEGVVKGKINIKTGIGRVNIYGGEKEKLVFGTLVSNIMDLNISSKQENNIQSVSIIPLDEIKFLKVDPENSLYLKINDSIPIDFMFQGGAADLNFNFRDVLAENINIDTGASNLNLKIGNNVSSNVKINAGVSSIDITLPKNMGVSLILDSGLSSRVLNGLVMENEKLYKNPNYDLFEKKINIEISMGIASLNINWEEIEKPKTKVQLYYYNELEDKEIKCGVDYVLPVEREIDLTRTPIQDAINLLIKGEIKEEEKEAGFITEFPNEEFKLLGVNLKDEILYLEFNEVPGFTSGGSCRVSLLANQIIKTAKQFSGINEVVLLPESIFQP